MLNYFDDDFVFKHKPSESAKDCEAFLAEKYASRKAKDPGAELPRRINLNEQKNPAAVKTSVVCLSWICHTGRRDHPYPPYIGAGFKQRIPLN